MGLNSSCFCLHLLYRSNSYARFPYKLADKPILDSVLLPNMYKYEAIQGECTIRVLDLNPGRTTEVLACDFAPPPSRTYGATLHRSHPLYVMGNRLVFRAPQRG